jgi:hypothetical protein
VCDGWRVVLVWWAADCEVRLWYPRAAGWFSSVDAWSRAPLHPRSGFLVFFLDPVPTRNRERVRESRELEGFEEPKTRPTDQSIDGWMQGDSTTAHHRKDHGFRCRHRIFFVPSGMSSMAITNECKRPDSATKEGKSRGQQWCWPPKYDRYLLIRTPSRVDATHEVRSTEPHIRIQDLDGMWYQLEGARHDKRERRKVRNIVVSVYLVDADARGMV